MIALLARWQAADERPAPAWLITAGAVVLLLAGVVTATYELLFTPLRAGGALVWVSVPLAIGTNVLLPRVARRIHDSPLLAAAPVLAWTITIVVLLSGRREGDVLLPTKPADLMYAGYAVFFLGMLAGVITVAVTAPRRPVTAPRRPGTGSGGAR